METEAITMNTEEFVSHEQAVKLKELGFDWPCNNYYIDKVAESEREEWDDEECMYCTVSDIKRYPKPRLYQAAKYMREVKGIYVVVEPRFSNYKLIGYDWMVYDDCSGDYALRAPLPFLRTYEEALSDGIDAALELLIQ